MALPKNGTISSGNTGTTGYSFPSGSFTPQKQPNMPSDQKAKLLAMHRDGKANAGIYVAVVLIVYFILVIILLCRYGKRRRTSETNSNLDAAAEQGRFQLINSHLCKVVSCGGGGDGSTGNLTNSCFGRCQRVETSSPKSVVHSAQNGTDDTDKDLVKNISGETDIQKSKGNSDCDKDSGVVPERCDKNKNDSKGKTQQDTQNQEHGEQNGDDSDDSIEEDD